eukprot:2227305-Rhodomonas_salina.2
MGVNMLSVESVGGQREGERTYTTQSNTQKPQFQDNLCQKCGFSSLILPRSKDSASCLCTATVHAEQVPFGLLSQCGRQASELNKHIMPSSLPCPSHPQTTAPEFPHLQPCPETPHPWSYTG